MALWRVLPTCTTIQHELRSRKTPNAPVEIGYRSAIAAHMANLAYRQKQRVTLEMAKAAQLES